MRSPCPSPEVWSAWMARALQPAELARWTAHLAGCPDCRDELAALAEPGTETVPPVLAARWEGLLARPARRWGRMALAAGVLLVVGLVLSRRTSPPAPEAQAPVVAVPVRPSGILERMLGSSGKASLASGSLARFGMDADGTRHLRLERGVAWLEAAGEPLRLSLPGCPGILTLMEGEVLAQVASEDPGLSVLLLGRADAAEGDWGIWILKGKARLEGSPAILGPGERLGTLVEAPRDFRGWEGPGDPLRRVRDATASFSAPIPGPYVAEMLLSKRDRTAEAALVFSVSGKSWRVPLGEHLRAGEAWVRLRLEAGGDRVRLLAGERELFSCTPGGLGEIGYPEEAETGWGLKAWGGELEVASVRWRRGGPWEEGR